MAGKQAIENMMEGIEDQVDVTLDSKVKFNAGPETHKKAKMAGGVKPRNPGLLIDIEESSEQNDEPENAIDPLFDDAPSEPRQALPIEQQESSSQIGMIQKSDLNLERRSLARNESSQLKVAVLMTIAFTFMIIEIVGGALAGSTAILADSMFRMTDMSSYIVSLTSVNYASKTKCVTR